MESPKTVQCLICRNLINENWIEVWTSDGEPLCNDCCERFPSCPLVKEAEGDEN